MTLITSEGRFALAIDEDSIRERQCFSRIKY